MFFFEPSGQAAQRIDYFARAAAAQASEDARQAQADAARRDLAAARRSLAVTSARVALRQAERRRESRSLQDLVRAVFEDR